MTMLILLSKAFDKAASKCRLVPGLVLLSLLSLQACGDAVTRDLQDFVDTAYQDKKPDIEPLPIIEPYKGFEYAAGELSDPFSRGNIINAESVDTDGEIQKRDINRRREKLEEYPLDSLAMVGTITKEGVPWVVVQTLEKLFGSKRRAYQRDFSRRAKNGAG